MTTTATIKQWVEKAFSALQTENDPAFMELWSRNRITCKSAIEIDDLDRTNAALISTALRKRKTLLIIHPDSAPHRGAISLGTALALDAIASIKEEKPGSRVIIFGTSASIKYTLADTEVGTLSLAEVFSQTNIRGRFSRYEDYERTDSGAEHLPEVICAYQPARPEEMIRTHDPGWIAIDCGRQLDIEWLEPLVAAAARKNLPVIAWGQNSYGNAADIFQRFGQVYYCPHGEASGTAAEQIAAPTSTVTTPWVMTGTAIDDLSRSFVQAQMELRKLPQYALSSVCYDALSVAWRLLRVLERLTVPVHYYDSKQGGLWRGYAVWSLIETLDRYEEITRNDNPKWRSKFGKACRLLRTLARLISSSQPPLWSALCSFCLNPPQPELTTVITFPTRWQRQLFTFVLLAQYNIAERELEEEWKIVFRTLRQMAEPSKHDLETLHNTELAPLLVGLPGLSRNHQLFTLLSRFSCDVLLYPHQTRLVDYIIEQFNERDHTETQTSILTICSLTDLEDLPPEVNASDRFDSAYEAISLPVELVVEPKVKRELDSLLKIGSIEDEVYRLLATDGEPEDEEGLVPDPPRTDDEIGVEASILVENALRIDFETRQYMLLRNNTQLNVYRGAKLINEYAKALKKGDVCLVIPNQQHHDLLKLVVERVTDHPALQIHFQLLQLWKQERLQGFMWWLEKNPQKSLYEFLLEMQALGCERISTLTIYSWLHGVTLCPQDKKDIYRLGQIFNSEFLIQNYQRIHKAASRLTGIKISVSRRLNNWLANGAQYSFQDEDALIDQELGLTLSDISSSFRVLAVSRVSKHSEPVLRDQIGRLQQNET